MASVRRSAAEAPAPAAPSASGPEAEWAKRLSSVSVSKATMDRLVMNWLVIEGYQEAAECVALFNAVHTLVVRAQHETAMIAGYWYHWLCKAYNAVSGNEPMC